MALNKNLVAFTLILAFMCHVWLWKTTVNVIVLFITYFMKKEKQLDLKMTLGKKKKDMILFSDVLVTCL